MLPPEGWFTISKYGAQGSVAAFLIVQHSDIEQWRRFVPVMEKLAAQRRSTRRRLRTDVRLALIEKQPQRYGSQMTCQAGRYAPAAIEDPDHIDERTSLHMGLYKDYLALYWTRRPADALRLAPIIAEWPHEKEC